MDKRFGRLTIFGFSVICYVAFLFAIGAGIVFLTGAEPFPNVDRGPSALAPVAVALDLALLGIFAVQHTVMARLGFKRWCRRFVPEPLERSLFVLGASLALLLLLWQWRPLPATVWAIRPALATVLWVIYAAGWLMVVASTFMIDHFDLFGLRQGWLALRRSPYSSPAFKTRWLYSRVRHPMMTGFLVALWATPLMSAGHLLFAAASTGYIAMGVWFEERDLIRAIPEYRAYRQAVGAIFPRVSALWSRRDQALPGPILPGVAAGAWGPPLDCVGRGVGGPGLADLQDRARAAGHRGRHHEHGQDVQ
jgi:protein-S-isoprenylcysteine O-methyltransferase Ste14